MVLKGIYSCKMTQIINLNFQLMILKKRKLQSRQKENNKGKINDIKKRKTTEKNSMKSKGAF